jgi:protein-L-isoaspartate(D-aspartate) O-methyltransferase
MNALDTVFSKTKRSSFLPSNVKERAENDVPLPIGFGQTNSQPSTVKRMLEWLGAQRGDRILDIGSGSGWTSALLSRLVGKNGKVYAVEKVPELVEFGRSNCQKEGCTNVEFYQAGYEYGLKQQAPFDRVLVSAAAKELPTELLDQLKTHGKLVIPVRNDILEITKNIKGGVKVEKHPGYVFVPLT